MTGTLDWHKRSGRNTAATSAVSPVLRGPIGLGTSAARIVVRRPPPPAQPISVPQPSPSVEPDARWDIAAHRATLWAREIGMLDPLFAVWNDSDVDAFSIAGVRAIVPAGQPGPVHDVAAAWYLWARFAGDFFISRYVVSRDVPGAKEFLARLPQFLTAARKPANPVERGLAELWSRSLSVAPAHWCDRFRQTLPDMFDVLAGRLTELVGDRTPHSADSAEPLRQPWLSYVLDQVADMRAAPELNWPVDTSFRLPTDEFSDVSVHERRAMLTARVACCFDDRGAFAESCDSRVTESVMMLALLRRQNSHPGAQETLMRFLRDRVNEPNLTSLERRLVQISLGTVPPSADPSAPLEEFDHFTADRKRLLLGTFLAVLGVAPYPAVDVAAIDYRGHASWVEVALCAVKVLNAHGQGRPGLITDQDRAFLRDNLRNGRREVWEGNVGAHLLALLAVREFAPEDRLIADGIGALLAARNPDGGLPFIPDYTCFLGGVAAVALSCVDADPVLLRRIGDYLVLHQAEDGSWPFTERVRQTDVEGGGIVVEALRAIDPARYRDALARGAHYLAGMANPDGGFPTYRRGHPSEVVMTANAVIALAPDWDTYSRVLEPAVDYLLSAQRPDGTYERSWSLSEAHAIRRVLHALHCVPRQSRKRFQQGIDHAHSLTNGYLMGSQNPDGGWGQRAGDDSDPISTAHSLSAAAFLDAPPWHRHGLAYLLRRQGSDGGFTSIPDQVAPRPIPYNFPGMASIFVLTALGDLHTQAGGA